MTDRLSLRTQDLSPKDKDNPEGGKRVTAAQKHQNYKNPGEV